LRQGGNSISLQFSPTHCSGELTNPQRPRDAALHVDTRPRACPIRMLAETEQNAAPD